MSVDFSNVKDIVIPDGSVKQIAKDDTVLWRKADNDWKGLTLTNLGTNNINLRFVISGALSLNLEYSLDKGVTWTPFGTALRTIPGGQSMWLRGDNPNGFSQASTKYAYFATTSTTLMKASGSVMSLIDMVGETKVIPNDFCFARLFYQVTNLQSTPDLPATTLTKSCYRNMFEMCTALRQICTLPANELKDQCYYQMFRQSGVRISQNGSGTKIFTCPETTGASSPVTDMFLNTQGSFKGTPTTGNTYYWYT